MSTKIDYTEEELKAVPEGANIGLRCANPVTFGSIKEGEIILISSLVQRF